ncbi:hypothetical protein [Lentzea sp. NPDC059081]|uniref:hypothetical protein n=1 Tax=Lentzea sp. NPDC059081 TaxID=3346719 RepID=UPI00367772D0
MIRDLLPPATREYELSEEEKEEVAAWLVRHSRPLYDVTDASAVRGLLDALATKLDGKSAAASVYQRKRAVLFNMLSYVVEKELIPDNPLTQIKRKVAKVVEQVGPRVVASPQQVEQLLTAVTMSDVGMLIEVRIWRRSSPWATPQRRGLLKVWRCERTTARFLRRVGVC